MGGVNWIPAILVFVLLALRVPVGVSFFSSAVIYFLFFNNMLPLTAMVQKMITANMSFTILALPFFLTVGVVMNYTSISDRCMNFCSTLLGHWRGSLAQVNVLLSTLLGGISGSSGADAALQSKILVPEMEKRGYSREFSAAVTAASSLISPIIPPGTGLILYATVTENSTLRMFAAGYIPGIMLCAAMMIVVEIVSIRKGYGKLREKKATLKEIMVSLKDSIFALLIPLFLLVGLRSGLFTPTEAGAITVLICVIIGAFIYRRLKPRDIIPILNEAFRSTGNVALIVISATMFGFYMSWEGIPQTITRAILGMTDNKYVYLLLVNLFLLFMGMLMDATPLTMIAAPILYPSAMEFGLNPIHFGIVMILNLAIGNLTPPFGGIMYQVCHHCKLQIPQFVKAAWPFILCMIIVLLMVTYIPVLATFLPDLLYGPMPA